MEIFETRCHGGSIESGLVSCKRLHISQVGKQLPTVDEFKDQVQILRILGEALKGDNEGMVDLRMYKILIVDVVDLLRLHNLVFAEQLQCNIFACLFVLCNLHLAETAYINSELPLPRMRPIS